jgi:outer membrane protein OmpA-like peptidoglycan-associated protein
MFTGAFLEALRRGASSLGPFLSARDASDLASKLTLDRWGYEAVRPILVPIDRGHGDISSLRAFPNPAARSPLPAPQPSPSHLSAASATPPLQVSPAATTTASTPSAADELLVPDVDNESTERKQWRDRVAELLGMAFVVGLFSLEIGVFLYAIWISVDNFVIYPIVLPPAPSTELPTFTDYAFSSSISFNSGSTALSRDAWLTITRIVAKTKGIGSQRVKVTTYATAPDGAGLALAKDRASAIRSALVTLGLPEDRILLIITDKGPFPDEATIALIF